MDAQAKPNLRSAFAGCVFNAESGRIGGHVVDGDFECDEFNAFNKGRRRHEANRILYVGLNNIDQARKNRMTITALSVQADSSTATAL